MNTNLEFEQPKVGPFETYLRVVRLAAGARTFQSAATLEYAGRDVFDLSFQFTLQRTGKSALRLSCTSEMPPGTVLARLILFHWWL